MATFPPRSGIIIVVELAILLSLFFFKDNLVCTSIDPGFGLLPTSTESALSAASPRRAHCPSSNQAWSIATTSGSICKFPAYQAADWPNADLEPSASALEWISRLNLQKRHFACTQWGNYGPFFETVIRYLGGLLSAYALSNEPARATELGEKLFPAFNTSSRLPVYGVNTQTKEATPSITVLLAEMGSFQMEYKYLAHSMSREDSLAATDKIMDIMENALDTKIHL
ncbi:glycoside hydrolase [Hysterangium stoloniferum]|nr:glycoside hydrolase [Hysterangium stoloniferum]